MVTESQLEKPFTKDNGTRKVRIGVGVNPMIDPSPLSYVILELPRGTVSQYGELGGLSNVHYATVLVVIKDDNMVASLIQGTIFDVGLVSPILRSLSSAFSNLFKEANLIVSQSIPLKIPLVHSFIKLTEAKCDSLKWMYRAGFPLASSFCSLSLLPSDLLAKQASFECFSS